MVTTRYVILSEAAQSAAKSKNLRTCDNIFGQIGAKILRLAPLAQDDTVVTTERQTEICSRAANRARPVV